MSLSYLNTIRQLLEPKAKGMLSKIVENLDEKLKNPNSRERKLLESFVAMILNISIVEKVMAETQALIAHAERLLLNRREDRHSHEGPSAGPVEEDKEENNEQLRIQSLQSLIAELHENLHELRLARERLNKQYQASLSELREEEIEEMQALLQKDFDVIFTNNETAQFVDLYTKRSAEESERLSTLINKAMKPVLQPQGVQKKDDIDSKETADARRYHAERFREVAASRLGETYNVNTQVQVVGLLKEMRPDVRIEAILIMSQRLGGTAEKYETFRGELAADYKNASARIDGAMDKLTGVINTLESELGRKATAREIGARVALEADVKAGHEAGVASTPTLKPYSSGGSGG